MTRAILALTMILFLGSTSLAAVECAWVLWKKDETLLGKEFSSRWYVLDSWKSRDQCLKQKELEWTVFMISTTRSMEKVLENEIQRAYELRGDQGKLRQVLIGTISSSIRHTYQDDTGEVSHRYVTSWRCLPDTIDPREKK